MNKIEKFEDLNIWKEGMRLSSEIFNVLSKCKFYSIRDQMIRSSFSIPSNIAEGFERDSNLEFIRFLNIAKASCGELRTQLYLCMNIGIIDKSKCLDLIEKSKAISAMIHKLIKVRREKF